MAEAVMCAPKPKKNKKKRHESKLWPMDSVLELEESCSSQDMQQIAQIAAETVFNDLLDKVAAFSLDPTNDTLSDTTIESSVSVIEALDNARATFEEIATAIGKLSQDNFENHEDEHILNEKLDENETVDHADLVADSPVDEIQFTPESEQDDNECKLNGPIDHDDDVVSEEPSRNDINLVEQEMPLSEKPSTDHVISPQSRSSLHETDSKEDNPQAPTLKPSVFVGRDKLYQSSLQLGCSWDRTKYNIVLLPDLKKVVYPDLDSLLSGKPVNMMGSLGDDLLMSSARRRIDRSSKPMPVIVPAPAIVHPHIQPIIKYHDVLKEIEQQASPPPPAKEAHVVKFDIPDTIKYRVDVENPKFTDFNLDGIDFRVFMNPVKWNPRDHHNQLLLFRVGPIFYEEFFTNCGTTDGFINVIKDRAAGLAKHQLHLAQACLLAEGGNSKLINLQEQDATLVIYNIPLRIDRRHTTCRIRFGVNEGFYEEDFRDCKSVKDIIESVKRRAEVISTQQKIFKTKANFETKSDHDDIGWCLSSESNSDVAQNIETSTYDFGEVSPQIKQQHDHPPLPPEETAGTSQESDQAHTNSKLRRTMKSVRNWFKDTFTKKPSKRSKKSRGGNEVLWQWNDESPASFSSSKMLDIVENIKE